VAHAGIIDVENKRRLDMSDPFSIKAQWKKYSRSPMMDLVEGYDLL